MAGEKEPTHLEAVPADGVTMHAKLDRVIRTAEINRSALDRVDGRVIAVQEDLAVLAVRQRIIIAICCVLLALVTLNLALSAFIIYRI